MMMKAVVLLSGGLDSSVTLSLAKSQGYDVYALSFDYGQKHHKELQRAQMIAERAHVSAHKIISLNMNSWGGSSLTDQDMEIEQGDIHRENIPNTYVPARNMVFLSIAASYAEAIGARHIFIGISEVDYSGYVDCREDFLQAMEQAINKGTVSGAVDNKPIKIHAPFIHSTKAEEITLGAKLRVDFSLTWSCYRGEETPCGTCDSCLLRAKAFREAGIADPLVS